MSENFLSSSSLPIGNYFGIPLRIHITFLILLFFQFQAFKNPQFGLLVVLGMTLSIILHEYGHALTAVSYGGRKGAIILWQFGGLATGSGPLSLKASLATTIGGPMITLILAVLLSALTAISERSVNPALREYVEVCRTLARFNWITLVFNLIPAFPMDGGQILRDLLAFHVGFSEATRIALLLSRGIAVVAVVAGLVLGNSTLLFASMFLFIANRWVH